MTTAKNAPVIIKRKKVVAGDGHHGGAWKVAYADFVTAMMAFFMMLWLLNATTEQQRAGIAEYFAPTLPIYRQSGGGDGAFGGEDIFSQETLAESGRGGLGAGAGESAISDADLARAAETNALQDLEATLMGLGGETMLSDNALRHIVTRLTDEGLVIELFDLADATLFIGETDMPQPVLGDIAGVLARLLQLVENDVAITGHVRAQSLLRVDYPVWDISADRADRLRVLLEGAGLDTGRIARLTGKADRDPVTRDGTALRNNRLELIVLRSDL